MSRSLFLAIPCYSHPEPHFVASLRRLEKALTKCGIEHTVVELQGESLISRARNRLVALFERSGFESMMFLDSDLIFEPSDVLRLFHSEHLFCGAPYPAKDMSGRMIGNPIGVQGAAGSAVERVVRDGFALAQDLPTGFMLIRRPALDKIRPEVPDVDDDMPGPTYGQPYHVYFSDGIDGRQMLSEDWFFSRLARKCGVEAWIDCRAELKHIGRYTYEAKSLEKQWAAPSLLAQTTTGSAE